MPLSSLCIRRGAAGKYAWSQVYGASPTTVLVARPLTSHVILQRRMLTKKALPRVSDRKPDAKVAKVTPVHSKSRTPSKPSGSRSIAVVGAGLAGLTAALNLARALKGPDSEAGKYRIVVYEAAARLGGWVQSERVRLPSVGGNKEDGSTALLELGPRSIRVTNTAEALEMMRLVGSLDLGDSLLSVSKKAPSARNRYLYHAGRLHIMPTDVLSAIPCFLDSSHPLRKAGLHRVFRLLSNIRALRARRGNALEEWADMSVTDALKQIGGSDGNKLHPDGTPAVPLVDYLGSAVFHGIYAADMSRLSMAGTIGRAADWVQRQSARWTRANKHPNKGTWSDPSRYFLDVAEEGGGDWAFERFFYYSSRKLRHAMLMEQLGDEVMENVKETSVISFKDGLQTLTDRMEEECRHLGVELRPSTKVTSIKLTNGRAHVKTDNTSGIETYDRVVASVPSSQLQTMLPPDVKVPHLTVNPSTTVCVLNVAVPKWMDIELPPAFGFLLPKACALEGDNPVGVLGVVFDSHAVPGQDECVKMTMMLGGPFWKPGYEMYDLIEAGKQQAAQDRALEELARFLKQDDKNVFKSQHILKRLTVQRDCIPTYTPEHKVRLTQMRSYLASEKRYAPLTLLGASYNGVSMNDIVSSSTIAAELIAAKEVSGLDDVSKGNVTGLDDPEMFWHSMATPVWTKLMAKIAKAVETAEAAIAAEADDEDETDMEWDPEEEEREEREARRKEEREKKGK